MNGPNGGPHHGLGGGLSRRLARLETSYLKLVEAPLEHPLPRLEVWLREHGALEATNPHTGETRPVAALAPGTFTVLVEVVDDRPI